MTPVSAMMTFAELREQLGGISLAEGVLAVKFGCPEASARLFWDTGCHGQENAPPLALLRFARTHAVEWPWPDLQVLAIVADGRGLDELGYGFIGSDGSESCWPPLWNWQFDRRGFWHYTDRNSAWGLAGRHLPESHLVLRQALHDFNPTFVYSSHETVGMHEREPFWVGSGPLLIESYPMTTEEVGNVRGIPDPGQDLLGFIGYLGRRWFTFITGQPRWKRNAKIMRDNPGWQLLSRIVARYENYGQALMDEAWMRYLELLGELSIGRGRILHDDILNSDWLILPEYAVRHFGIPAMTSETFTPGGIGMIGLDTRIKQTYHLALSICDVL